MKNIWRLLGLVPEYKSRLVKVLLFNSILGLAGLATPYVYKNILDLIVNSVQSGLSAQVWDKILIALAVLLGLGIIGTIFDYLAERLSDLLFIDIIWEIRKKLFSHLSRLSIDYFERTRTGEIIERINAGTSDFSRWVFMISDGLLGTIIMIVLVMAFLWVKLPLIGLIMTLSLSLNFYWSLSKVLKTKPLRREWHKHSEGASGEVAETISHIATVRSFAQEKFKFDNFIQQIDKYRHLRLDQARIEWSTNFYRSLLNAVTVVLCIGVVAYGVVQGRSSVGDILLVSLYLQQLRGSIGPISRLIINTGDIETSSERVVEILKVTPTVVDQANAKAVEAIKTVEFKEVSFVYPGKDKKVLDSVSFRLTKGKSLALVGPSGVGKTTITKLLMRFYAPTSGQILINNQPIESFTQDSLRGKIGTVMQDVALFNDTIEENLRFSRPEATHEQIAQAAKVAHADIFINKLADGYQTLVGERGIKLSGGEKQRVAVARAILRDPELIILDEATSSLDSQSEKYVQDGLEKLMAKRTAVIIAHRLSTVRKADQILVLENGRVVERGSHEDLVKNEKLYAKFLKLQTGLVDS